MARAQFSNNQKISVVSTLFSFKIQNTALYQLLGRKLTLPQPKSGHKITSPIFRFIFVDFPCPSCSVFLVSSQRDTASCLACNLTEAEGSLIPKQGSSVLQRPDTPGTQIPASKSSSLLSAQQLGPGQLLKMPTKGIRALTQDKKK